MECITLPERPLSTKKETRTFTLALSHKRLPLKFLEDGPEEWQMV
jgi:hypothetical protein